MTVCASIKGDVRNSDLTFKDLGNFERKQPLWDVGFRKETGEGNRKHL
jgi:hypothetical protein